MKCPLWVLLTQQQTKPTFLWVVTRWEEGILRHQSLSSAQGHLCSRPGSNMKPLRLGGPMGSPQIYSKSTPHLLTQRAGSFYDIISGKPHKPFSLRLVGMGMQGEKKMAGVQLSGPQDRAQTQGSCGLHAAHMASPPQVGRPSRLSL